jgi:hypothetical protein
VYFRRKLFFFSEIPFLLAVDAATILLPIEPKCLGLLDPLFPPLAKITVEKRYPLLVTDLLTDLFDERMVLVSAVEQGRGKGAKFAVTGYLCGSVKPKVIAEPAALLLAECDPPQELFETVFVPIDHLQRGLFFIVLYCF